MSKRERDLRLHIMVSREELDAIKERMEELGCCNRVAFLRKMAIDGYAVNVDIAPAKELISQQRRCVNNLKQIAKYAQTHNACQAEILNCKKAMPNYGNSIQNS
jgi:hypothetical protein